MSWIWLIAAIVTEIGATLSLRASDGFRKRLWIIPIITGYALACGFLGLALNAGMPVAVGYGIWTAVGVALVALLARMIWHDPLTRQMIAGVALIGLGVVLIETG